MASVAVRNRLIAKRHLDAREKIWPGVTNGQLWVRTERDGFVTLPRLMPLILDIMDDLAPKGTPISKTYLELWCRLYDEMFLTLVRHEELAFHAGFSGQRAVRTWRERVKILAELGFIDVKSGPSGELSYALFWNPYHVLKKHFEAGSIQEAKWRALLVRANDIKATDLEPPQPDEDGDEEQEEEAAASVLPPKRKTFLKLPKSKGLGLPAPSGTKL